MSTTKTVEYLDVKTILKRTIKPGTLRTGLLGQIGKSVAAEYRREYGKEPNLTDIEHNGNTIWVKSYNIRDEEVVNLILTVASEVIHQDPYMSWERKDDIDQKIAGIVPYVELDETHLSDDLDESE